MPSVSGWGGQFSRASLVHVGHVHDQHPVGGALQRTSVEW